MAARRDAPRGDDTLLLARRSPTRRVWLWPDSPMYRALPAEPSSPPRRLVVSVCRPTAMPKAAEAGYAPKANPVDPLALKKEGNEHFKRGSFESAAKCYTTAIDLWSMPLPPAPSPSPCSPAPSPAPVHQPRLLPLLRPPPPPPTPPLPLPLEHGTRRACCSHTRVPRGGALWQWSPRRGRCSMSTAARRG